MYHFIHYSMDPIDLGPHHRLHEGLRGMQGSRLVFVNSMSDLFYPDIPAEFIHRVFAVMNDMQQHTYQVLTKRADRLLELNDRLNWTPNIWMGASVEDRRVTRRIDLLLQSREAEVTFFFKQWGGIPTFRLPFMNDIFETGYGRMPVFFEVALILPGAFDVHSPPIPVPRLRLALRPPVRPHPEFSIPEPLRRGIGSQ